MVIKMKTIMYFLLAAIGISTAILFAVATIKDTHAGGDDLANTKYNITVFRGDGVAEVDSFTGEETVLKKPTKRNWKKSKKSSQGGARIVGAGNNTLWYVDSRGKLHACDTIGTGYTGGSQRITCTK